VKEAAAIAPVVLHLHLFKNAGSTLDWSLGRFFQAAFCDHREDQLMRGSPEYLRRYLADHSSLRALSSHWLPLPLDLRELPVRPFPLVMLRHPIERMASVYAFERRQEVDHPGTRRAREGSLQDYVAWRLEEGTGPVLKNYQSRMLSGDYPGDGDRRQLERALDNLQSFAGVGLVERFDESMVLFEASLREHFPAIDLSYRAQNVRDPGDRRAPEERLTAVESELGDLLEPARAANELDLALYERAAGSFRECLGRIPDLGERVGSLHRRCRSLESK
jgi:hypothetical protein